MKSLSILALILMTLSNIIAQEIKTPDTLQTTSDLLKVKGKLMVQINHKLSFGEYHTSNMKGGLIMSKGGLLLGGTTTSKQEFHFTQSGPGDIQATVNCLGKFEQPEIDKIRHYYSIKGDYTNIFSGDITFDGDTSSWTFIVNNPDSQQIEDESYGFVFKTKEKEMEIFAVVELEDKKVAKIFQSTILGFEFRKEGIAIGNVSLLNKGEVRISNNISDKEKLVIASIATGLLARSDLEDFQ